MYSSKELTFASTLVDTEPTVAYQQWLDDHKIKRLEVDIATNKEGIVNTTLESLCKSLLFVMDSSNYPLYIHCNQGKHRTGCVVACLRKIQHWPMESIIEEYIAYAGKKARDGDIELIKSFDPNVVFEYAQIHGYVNGSQPRLHRHDSTLTDIDSLAAALSAGALNDELVAADYEYPTISSTSSETSESPLEMCSPGLASVPNARDKLQQATSSHPSVVIRGTVDIPLSNETELLSAEVEAHIKAMDGKKVAVQDGTIMGGPKETGHSVALLINEMTRG